ncbi:MAG: type II toxin-antitoxin system RelE/ParE family toxin [Thermodesulfobacteriota bacterium]|nr:type II toxin-antitoxin system RelE/ParE family toxin [Thermodesulfobacteriota bacterium]
MGHRVILPRSTQKELDRINEPATQKILKKLHELRENPRPSDCKKLTAREAWRVRVGDYRIIYEIDDKEKAVTIFTIRHRRDAYRSKN